VDENFARVDPYPVEETIHGIYLADSALMPEGADTIYLTTFDPVGEPTSVDVPVPLTLASDGQSHIARFDLVQGACSYSGTNPFVRVAIGDGRVTANFSPAGSKVREDDTTSDSNATDCKGRLRLKFLKRDGSGELTENDGATQETEIGGPETNFAEITRLQIQSYDQCDEESATSSKADVGIRELAHGEYLPDPDVPAVRTDRFFDGVNHTSNCQRSNGICDFVEGSDWNRGSGAEKWVSLVEGKANIVVASNSTARLVLTAGAVVPYIPSTQSLPSGSSFYAGDDSALLEPVYKKAKQDPLGDRLEVGKWVDEQSIEIGEITSQGRPYCNPSLSDDAGPDGTRDWLELKMWDFYCNPPEEIGNTQAEADALWMFVPTLTLLDPVFGEVYQPATVAGEVWGSVDRFSIDHHKIFWNPAHSGMRNPSKNIFENGPSIGGYKWLVGSLYEFDYVYYPSIQHYYQLQALHELRHVFQRSLVKNEEGNLPDSDVDGLPDSGVHSDLSELRDLPHSQIQPNGGNTDFSFSVDATEPNNEYFLWKKAAERDAVRFSMLFNDYTHTLPASPPIGLDCTVGLPESATGDTTGTLDVGGYADLMVVLPYHPQDGPTGDVFLGGIPIEWTVLEADRAICLIEADDGDAPTTIVALDLPLSGQGSTSEGERWGSSVRVKGLAVGDCHVKAEMLDPSPPAPNDCVSEGPLAFSLTVVAP
jgi:hypothetical protein